MINIEKYLISMSGFRLVLIGIDWLWLALGNDPGSPDNMKNVKNANIKVSCVHKEACSKNMSV